MLELLPSMSMVPPFCTWIETPLVNCTVVPASMVRVIDAGITTLDKTMIVPNAGDQTVSLVRVPPAAAAWLAWDAAQNIRQARKDFFINTAVKAVEYTFSATVFKKWKPGLAYWR